MTGSAPVTEPGAETGSTAESGSIAESGGTEAAAGSPASRPRIVITYCTQCRWLLRASWVAQELLTTFSTDLGEVALRPGVGGVFTIELDGELIWDRKRDDGFPDVAPLKRLIRDRIDPGRSLGHSDRLR